MMTIIAPRRGRRSGLLAALAAGLLLAWAGAGAGEARAQHDRTWSGSVTGPRGTSTFERRVIREPGSVSGEGSWTGPQGRTGSRTFERTWDRDEGTGSASWSRTGPGGRTATGERDVIRSGDGTFEVEATRTGRNGVTRTREGTIVRE
jgi:hypothetical protein